jgi:hypothetical protein
MKLWTYIPFINKINFTSFFRSLCDILHAYYPGLYRGSMSVEMVIVNILVLFMLLKRKLFRCFSPTEVCSKCFVATLSNSWGFHVWLVYWKFLFLIMNGYDILSKEFCVSIEIYIDVINQLCTTGMNFTLSHDMSSFKSVYEFVC